jgi:hypothetical protein
MTYLLITIIIFVALAPLWHFMPSRRQRREAKLRETAALAGLFVEFRDLPLPEAQRARLPSSERQVLYYGRRLKRTRGDARRSAAWWRKDGEWRSSDPHAALPSVAPEMPPAVLALGITESSCGVYWQEEGEEETVRALAALLTRWAGDAEGSS